MLPDTRAQDTQPCDPGRVQNDLLLHLHSEKGSARGHARLLVSATLPTILTARWLTARLSVQVIYPATSSAALSEAGIQSATREAQAAAMGQALALLRWAHKFGPEKLVQRAERFLGNSMKSFTRVRSQLSAPLTRWHFTNYSGETPLWLAAGGLASEL